MQNEINVVFVKNKVYWYSITSMFYFLLRKIQNRWYNHVAILDLNTNTVYEYLGNGYNETDLTKWQLKQLDRQYYIRQYATRFTNEEIVFVKKHIKEVTKGYEFGIYWKIPLIMLFNKINIKIDTILKADNCRFYCSDWIYYFFDNYNPNKYYTLQNFSDITNDDIIKISKEQF